MEKTFVYKDFIESVPWWMLDQTLNMTPWINIVWWWVKNAIDWSKNMRILRWIEFFETIWLYPEFLKELEESEQALDWLAICFEFYTKQRIKEKRNFIKNIFLWFIKLSEIGREKFELERLIDITNKITLDEIFFLKFLNDEIKPIQIKYSKIKASESYESTKNSGKWESYDFWYNWNLKDKPLTSHLYEYFYNLHNPNSKYAQEKYWYTWKENEISSLMFNNENIEIEKNRNLISIINSLWLFNAYLMSSWWWLWSWWVTNSYSYNLSTLWEQFINYTLENES